MPAGKRSKGDAPTSYTLDACQRAQHLVGGRITTAAPILSPCRNAPLPQPEPPQTTWTIYKFASRLQWLGTVQATDNREAIEKATKEFRLDPAKLMAERQR